MRLLSLAIPCLLSLAFSLATWLDPWFQSWAGSRTGSANVLAVALGDSRKLFASHFYLKADAYFHNGYYPDMFNAKTDNTAISGKTPGRCPSEPDEHAQPQDWLARFSRHFYPSEHRHLGEGKCEHHDHDGDHEDHDEAQQSASGTEREMLPWLKLAATLDPENPETYVIASFWLRTRLGKVKEAETFLRDGLRANPGHPALLFELGKIYYDDRSDIARARNIWELGVRKWHETERGKREPDLILYDQMLAHLAALEEESGNHARALIWLQTLRAAMPNRSQLDTWIQNLRNEPPGILDLQNLAAWLVR